MLTWATGQIELDLLRVRVTELISKRVLAGTKRTVRVYFVKEDLIKGLIYSHCYSNSSVL